MNGSQHSRCPPFISYKTVYFWCQQSMIIHWFELKRGILCPNITKKCKRILSFSSFISKMSSVPLLNSFRCNTWVYLVYTNDLDIIVYRQVLSEMHNIIHGENKWKNQWSIYCIGNLFHLQRQTRHNRFCSNWVLFQPTPVLSPPVFSLLMSLMIVKPGLVRWELTM